MRKDPAGSECCFSQRLWVFDYQNITHTKVWALPLLLFLGALASACCKTEHYRIAITPSLRPVDTARPVVVFSQIRGEACGRDAVAGALRDMKRLANVDGYLEVVVEEMGQDNERCARATAYPFRYGTNVDSPIVRVGPEGVDPVRVPGRSTPAVRDDLAGDGTGAAVSSPQDCAASCDRAVNLLEMGEVNTALTVDRCKQRCEQTDQQAFRTCIDRVDDAGSVRACLESH